jgi:Txe/YoeB family toxin of Txe-Axe toxin-antitoxin module
MTYKGESYQGVIDIQILLIVAETQLRAYKAEQKAKRLKNDPDLSEIARRINIQEKFIKEVSELLDDLLEKMDKLASGMNDLETQIFLKKYMIGKDNLTIMDELAIAKTTYYDYCKKIDEKIKTTPFGRDLITALTE